VAQADPAQPVRARVDGEARRDPSSDGGQPHLIRGASVGDAVADGRLPQRFRAALVHGGTHRSVADRVGPSCGVCGPAGRREHVEQPAQRRDRIDAPGSARVPKLHRYPTGPRAAARRCRPGQDLDAQLLVIAQARTGGDDLAERIVVVVDPQWVGVRQNRQQRPTGRGRLRG
jgi:hypothetical protein